jgi:hypothetical protein
LLVQLTAFRRMVPNRHHAGIRWVDTPLESVWLDRGIYKIDDPSGLWALTFPERPRDGVAPNLRLNEHALALVRRCGVKAVKEDFWYVVEFGGHVIACSLFKKKGAHLIFRCGEKDTAPKEVRRDSITALAEILMVTTRPPLPAPQ